MDDEGRRHLAVDVGASGGVTYAGRVTPEELSVTAVSRFENGPVEADGRYVWDVDRLLEGVLDGLETCVAEHGPVDSVGIDTWGVDAGFVADGELVQSPYAYRDPPLTSTREELFDAIGRRELFERTGVAHWEAATTLYHCHYLAREEPELLERAEEMLLIPQLLARLLGAEPSCERTIASTTQLFDPRADDWDRELLAEVGFPADLLPPVGTPGRSIGTLDSARVSGNSPEIVLPASHDTAAAVAALPLGPGERVFLSSGTTFVVGVEVDEPVRSGRAFEAGVSNELGVGGTARCLQNVTGFFILEECRRSWAADGREVAYGDLIEAMEATEPFGPLVDPDHPPLGVPGEMPAKLREYCRETGQEPPDGVGATVRCVLESLALKTAAVIDRLRDVTGDDSDVVHLGGGGVRNAPFCQLLADAVGRPVVAGPVEAAGIGNVLTQASAHGAVSSLEAGRRLVESSFDLATYRPDPGPEWADARSRMAALLEEGDSPDDR